MGTALAEIDFGHLAHRHSFVAISADPEIFWIPQQIGNDPIHIYRTVEKYGYGKAPFDTRRMGIPLDCANMNQESREGSGYTNIFFYEFGVGHIVWFKDND